MNLIKKMLYLNGAALALSGTFYSLQSAGQEEQPLAPTPIKQNIIPEKNTTPTGTTDVAHPGKTVTPAMQPRVQTSPTHEPDFLTTTLNNIPADGDVQKLLNRIFNKQSEFCSTLSDLQQKIAERENLKMRQLMALTCSTESTKIEIDSQSGLVNSIPFEAFYFCSANALTIGYGTKIEYQDGKLCKEGVEMLKILDIKRNGRSLTLPEKEQMVQNCFARRNAYDKRHSKKLRKLKPEAQKDILFTKDDYACIDTENAYYVAQCEYAKKMNKLFNANPYLGSSYLLLALSSDFAYQYGDTGVKKFDIYKVNGPITLSELLDASSFKVIKKKDKNGKITFNERTALRRLVLEMAIQNAKDKKARGNKLATPESQAVFYMTALKKFATTFNDGIMNREDQKTVLMEQFMTLVMMQCMYNVTGHEPGIEDLKSAQNQAHNLVYDELFHSNIIQQLPNQIRPITLTSAIDAINISEIKTNSAIAIEELRASILTQAQTRLKRYNKKNKSAHQINTAAAYNLIANNDKSGRW